VIYNTSSFIISGIARDTPAAPKQRRAGSGGGVHHYIQCYIINDTILMYQPTQYQLFNTPQYAYNYQLLFVNHQSFHYIQRGSN